jgi:hypothetical protein
MTPAPAEETFHVWGADIRTARFLITLLGAPAR